MNSEGIDIYAFRETAASKILKKLKILHNRQEEHEADRTKPLYGDKTPFSVGRVENRMARFARENNIELATPSLYMSEEKLLHSIRTAKRENGKVVSDRDLANFPAHRYKMSLYWDKDKGTFLYQHGLNAFVVHPNQEIKMTNGKKRHVIMITATKMKGVPNYNGLRYIKIE